MDTCDQCGPAVSAKFIVSLPSGGLLQYCGHCADVHAEKLEELGALLIRKTRDEDDE